MAAEIRSERIKSKPKDVTIHRESSHTRQVARKAGIDLPEPKDKIEQEAVDSY